MVWKWRRDEGFLKLLGRIGTGTALLCFAVAPARAQVLLSTGDIVTVAVPVRNSASDSVSLQNVQVLTTVPDGFEIFANPFLGSASISQGATLFFVASYSVNEFASTGPASVGFGFSIGTPNLSPAPNAVGAQVSLKVIAAQAFADDVTPPVTTLGFSGTKYTDPQGNVYVSTATGIALTAVDPEPAGVESAGVAETDFLLNSAFIDTNTTPMNEYIDSFTLSEGVHLLYYESEDFAGNIETAKSATLRADGTPPVTSLSVLGASVSINGTFLIGAASPLSFSSADPPLASTASIPGSGVAGTNFYIDVAPSQCVGVSTSAAAPQGTCADPRYSFPFFLSPGTHTVYWYSTDNVGNAEALHSLFVAVDAAPPLLSILSPSNNAILNAQSPPIAVSYADPAVAPAYPGAGVDTTTVHFVIDGVDYSTQAVISSTQAQVSLAVLPDGVYAATVTVTDRVGNGAAAFVIFSLDRTPPATQLAFTGPSFLDSQGRQYVSGRTLIGLSAADPPGPGASFASGAATTYYLIDQVFVSTAFPLPGVFTSSFTLGAGTHTLTYWSADHAGNYEAPHVSTIGVDATPPQLTFAYPPPNALLNAQSVITATYFNPDLAPGFPGAGVDSGTVRVLIDNVDYTTRAVISATQMTINAAAGPDGFHIIQVSASDRVGNSSSTATSYTLDSTPPQVAISVAGSSPAALGFPAGAFFTRSGRPPLSAGYADLDSGLSTGTISLALDGAALPAAITTNGGPGGAPLGWTPTQPLPGKLYHAGSAVLNGFVYLAGGGAAAGLTNQVIYAKLNADGSLGPWAQTASLPTAGQSMNAAAWGSAVYVLGGQTGSGELTGVYYARPNADGSLGPWNQAANVPFPGGGGANGAAAVNGFLYAFGGGNFNCTIQTQVFFAALHADGSLGPWSQTTSLPAGVDAFQVAVQQGDLTVYLPGGDTANCGYQPQTAAWRATPDPATGKLGPWLAATPLPYPTEQNVTLAASGNLYVIENYPAARTVLFAPINPDHGLGAWTNDPKYYLPVALTGSAGAAAGGRLYVMGGLNAAGALVPTVYTTPLSAGIATLATASYAPASDIAEGSHTLTASAVDVAGNPGSSTTIFGVDLTPPVSGLRVLGSSHVLNGTVYVPYRESLSISAADPVINGAASGVSASYLGTNGGPVAPSTQPFALADGSYSLGFYSVDNVGNIESTKTVQVLMDSVAPSSAADLAAVSPTTSSLALSWTSVGDNGNTGTILSGELRVQYSAYSVAFATQSAQLVVPVLSAAPGNLQALTVTGLLPQTTYQFALWTRDTAGNWSAISPIAAAETLGLAQSADGIAALGSPVAGMSVSSVPISAQPGAFAVSVSSDGLGLLTTSFYQLNTPTGAEVYFSTPAVLSFVFNAAGVDLTQVAIYRYDTFATAWTSAPVFGQALTALGGGYYQISGDILSASLYSVFVKVDVQPPRTALAVGGPSVAPVLSPSGALLSGALPTSVLPPAVPLSSAALVVFVTSRTPVNLSSIDDLKALGDGVGVGVAYQRLSVDGVFRSSFTDPGPGRGLTFSSTFTLAADADGIHALSYFSQDILQQREAVHVATVAVDDTPPVTVLGVSGGFQFPAASLGGVPAFYASSATLISFIAADPAVNGVASGVAFTQYQDCGAAAPAPGAGCALPFQLFGSTNASGGAFALAEGIHALNYRSQDNVRNLEVLRSTAVLVDATPPITALSIIGGRQFPAPAGLGVPYPAFYASSTTAVGFAAADPVSGGVASGLALTRYQDCGALAAGCPAPFQSFSAAQAAQLPALAEGEHVLGYQSQDNVRNLEVLRSTTVLVDATPPVSSATVGSPKFMAPPDGTLYVTPTTPVTLSVADPALLPGGSGAIPGSGVNRLEVSVDGGAFAPYSSAMTFAEGTHTVLFRAVDNVGNIEATHTLSLRSDATPPVTALAVSSPSFSPGAGQPAFVSAATLLTLAATDPLSNGVASGVALTRYRVNGGAFVQAPFAFKLLGPDGTYTIDYQSQDNVGNLEVLRSTSVLLDQTPPVVVISSPLAGQVFVAKTNTIPIRFSAKDNFDPNPQVAAVVVELQDQGAPRGGLPAVVPVTSGQNLDPLSIDDGLWQLQVTATDFVGNSTTAYGGVFQVIHDIQPPRTSPVVGSPQYVASGSTYIATGTPLSLSAVDDLLVVGDGIGLGVRRTYDSVDNAPFTAYAGPITITQDGAHAWRFYSVDVVGNVESTRTATLLVDATPPVSSLSIGRPQFALSSSTVLVSSRTPFSIAAVDPLVNGVASGLRQSFYRINNSTFSAYSAPFTVSGTDGLQTVAFYSQDNVLNTEAVKSSFVSLDATPPQAAILSPSASGSGICRVLKGSFPVVGSALDAHLQSYVLDFAPSQNASSGFVLISSAAFAASGSGLIGISSGALGLWDTGKLSGWQTLRLTATDLVQNATVVTVNVYVGDPAELLVLGNHSLFNMPRDVAVDSGQNIFVADTNDNLIKEFNSTGTFLAVFGLGDGRAHARNFDPDDNPAVSTTTLRLNKPKGVAVDAAGNIYIADTNNDRVLELSATGQVLLELGKRSVDGTGREHFKPGSKPGEFNAPAAVSVGGSGNIYVADTENRRVQVFTSTGGVTLVFSLPALTPICTGSGASTVCAPPDDDDDSGEDGYPAGDGVGNLGRPEGIAVDLAGNIYVADPKGSRALKFDPAGKLLLTIPILGQPASQNSNSTGTGAAGGVGSSAPLVAGKPHGIAVSPSGDCILVSDRKFARVLKFDALGNQLLAFGMQGKIPDNQAPPAGIVFQKPVGLALDASGNLYVADRNNDRVEEFGLPTGNPPLVVPPPASDPNAARDVVASADGGAVSRPDGASVQVPPGALSQDLKITVSSATDQDALQISLASQKAGNKGLQVAYAPISFSPEGTQFSQAVTLVMPYTPGLLLAQGLTEDQLAIDYWNPAKSDWEALPSVVDKVNRLVTAKTSHFSLYQVHGGTGAARALAEPQPAADPAFVFRDLYAFPNPALRGKSPTIRLQVGIADSVEIHIYDISGKLVHQAGISAPPQPLDDGNGKGTQYTYDYAWDVSGVGSGVYVYSVTAKKSGKTDIRRIKKLGVVK